MTATELKQMFDTILEDASADVGYKEEIRWITQEDLENDEVDLWGIADDFFELYPDEVLPVSVAKYMERLYLQLIDTGYAPAMTNLGALYYTGRIGVQDFQKAIHYYTMAANLGDAQATENLGYCYYYGRSVDVDYEKSFHYFVKGALLGRLNSLYKMGDMYAKGQFVEQDEREAYGIYKHCYDEMKKNPESNGEDVPRIIGADICKRMGDACFMGMGTDIDLDRALQFYQEAEVYFYQKLRDGNYFARKGLQEAVSRQSEVRKKIAATLPDFEWTKP